MTRGFREVPPEERGQLHRLNNIEEMIRILESGTDEELEELRQFKKVDKEKIDFVRYFAKMRKEVIEALWEELRGREAKNPKATEEEMDMGCYVEHLEPQVRDAVLSMRKKGYTTTGSGFGDFGESQWISFEEKTFGDFMPSKELTAWLEDQKVEMSNGPDLVYFVSPPKATIEQITDIWNRIEAEIPDLGHPAEPSDIPAADSFRSRQKRLLEK